VGRVEFNGLLLCVFLDNRRVGSSKINESRNDLPMWLVSNCWVPEVVG